MIDRIQLKINEIKSYFTSRQFDHIIEKLIAEIYSSNCKLMVNPNVSHSKHQVTSVDCIIILGVSKDRNELEILWDLFHEFGHHLDPNKLSKEDSQDLDKRITREKAAWIYADKEFIKHATIHDLKESYISYRTICLQSYEIENYESLF